MPRPPRVPLVLRAQPGARQPTRLPPIADEHRDRSRRAIADLASACAPGRCVVLGAGKCDEIPLADLTTHFSSVELIDEDNSALDEGLTAAELSFAQRERISIRVADLTAAGELLAAELPTKKLQQLSAAAGETPVWIDQLAEAVERLELPPAARIEPADFLVASCLISQLHLTTLHRELARVEAVFGSSRGADLVKQLQESQRWTESMWHLARRLEDRFVDRLAEQLAQGGTAFVSDTVQVCFVERLPDGNWSTEGLYRMTRTPRLADYFDDRFKVRPLGEWAWVVDPPTGLRDVGRVYRVQALCVTAARPAGAQ